MLDETPSVVIAEKNGTVVSQNAPARRLMGDGRDGLCWNVVGGLKQAEGLPCRRGCVADLLAKGVERSRQTRLELSGKRYALACVPVGKVVVCVLSPSTNESPEKWQRLTTREREVLQLLAAGETTASAANDLGVSTSTIRTHVEKMRLKLGVNTRAALVALGFRLGYLG